MLYSCVCVNRSCHPLQWSHRHGIRRRSFGSTSPHIRHQTTHVYAWYVVLDPIMNYSTPSNLFQNPGCTAYTSTGVSQYVQILTSFLFGLGSTVGMSVPHRWGSIGGSGSGQVQRILGARGRAEHRASGGAYCTPVPYFERK